MDLFAKDRIIIPINLGNSHWVCSAINIREKRFEYYDSLGHQNSGVYKVSPTSDLDLSTVVEVGQLVRADCYLLLPVALKRVLES